MPAKTPKSSLVSSTSYKEFDQNALQVRKNHCYNSIHPLFTIFFKIYLQPCSPVGLQRQHRSGSKVCSIGSQAAPHAGDGAQEWGLINPGSCLWVVNVSWVVTCSVGTGSKKSYHICLRSTSFSFLSGGCLILYLFKRLTCSMSNPENFHCPSHKKTSNIHPCLGHFERIQEESRQAATLW